MKKANVQNLAVKVSKWPLLSVEVAFETWQGLATQSPTMSCENIVVQQLFSDSATTHHSFKDLMTFRYLK
jgi:hypothetical protein